MRFNYHQGQTPLDPNEIEGLIPGHIQTIAELNEWEQNNINKALSKYLIGSNTENIFDVIFLQQVHYDMFNLTWQWAGELRKSNKSIGVDWSQITEEVKKACDDYQYYERNQTYSAQELAIRYHHRLVSIHLFPNGNGRHARLIADIYLDKKNENKLIWGATDLMKPSEQRKLYILALQKADHHDFEPLIQFCSAPAQKP